jgi:hypothetical protein
MLKDLPLPLLRLDALFQEVKNIDHMSFVLPEIHLQYQSYADILCQYHKQIRIIFFHRLMQLDYI